MGNQNLYQAIQPQQQPQPGSSMPQLSLYDSISAQNPSMGRAAVQSMVEDEQRKQRMEAARQSYHSPQNSPQPSGSPISAESLAQLSAGMKAMK